MNQLEKTTPVPPGDGVIPLLENGDRLTREEFERRYEAMPGLKKAELIRGVVVMPSPVRHKQHGRPHFQLVGWLNFYTASTPGIEGGDNGSLKLGDEDEPQPDAYLIVAPEKGGNVRFDEEGYIVGAPEWVGEVSASSVRLDSNDKLISYAAHGVQEYVVWRVLDRIIDWYVIKEGRFEPLTPGADGIFRSQVMPGLWLDAEALIAGDMQRVFQAVQEGLRSPEHQFFSNRLNG